MGAPVSVGDFTMGDEVDVGEIGGKMSGCVYRFGGAVALLGLRKALSDAPALCGSLTLAED
jgi:hypothetical protein